MRNIYNKFRWRHVLVLAFLLSIALAPYLAFADDPGPTRDDPDYNAAREYSGSGFTKKMFTILGDSAGYETGRQNTVGNVIAMVINGALALLGTIFLIEIFYAGYLWMTAQGNEEQVTKAKSLIRQAIMGVIVIVAAYAIVYFVLAALLAGGGGGGTTAE